jgi:hypothetical protein
METICHQQEPACQCQQARLSAEESVPSKTRRTLPSTTSARAHHGSVQEAPHLSRPYLSTMLCRGRPAPSTLVPKQERRQLRRGSLFEKLCQQGVSEDVACQRQDLYNRLRGAVDIGYYDDDDDDDDETKNVPRTRHTRYR